MQQSDTFLRQSAKNIRVVLVSRFPKSICQPRGGVETATIGLAKALIDYGATDLHIVTIESGISKQIQEQHESINVHRLPRSRMPMFLDALGGPSIKTLNDYLHRLDPSIVHFHETWGFSSSTCEYPTVFTVHGFDSLNLPASKPQFWRIRSKIWGLVERKGLRRQKNIISIAPYVKREIEKRSSANIYEIWNPISLRYFSLKRNACNNRILFMGWLNSRKNPIGLVKATSQIINEFPDLQVELCGEASDPKYLEALEKTIEELNLASCVSIPGRQSQDQVLQKLSTATMLVLPSYQENAPMVVAEAMAAGIPVIASNKCGMPDMVEDKESGILVDPDDEFQLANAMRDLLANSNRRDTIAKKARTVAFKRFHPESVASKTIDAYLQIITNQDPNRSNVNEFSENLTNSV